MRSGLAMLRACMIDGFGWFQPADYRRTWLFFDDVDYVLPRPGSGPLFYSAWVRSMPECRAVFPELDKEAGGCPTLAVLEGWESGMV